MNTLLTDKKYTVMLSAYQGDCDELDNLLRTEIAAQYIERNLHLHPIRAVGVYHGNAELSFIIHTNSSQKMTELKRYALNECNQECVLVSNNRKHDIQLHNSDATTSHIGHGFKCQDKAPKGATSYTVLNGCDYWSVK
jgi:hypothetical protein